MTVPPFSRRRHPSQFRLRASARRSSGLESNMPPGASSSSSSGNSEQVVRLRCYFEGRVQGVGFRATTRRFARNHGVVGTVRNLPDGRVILVCEGRQAQLDALRGDLRGHFAGYIVGEECRDLDPTGEFADFRILP